MTVSTTRPNTTAETPALPVDIETMRAGARRLLGPDDGPGMLPPPADEMNTLTRLLRGHLELLAPEVEQAAGELKEGSILRYSALGCVWEARSRLEAEPGRRYGGAAGHARRLARVLNVLCDHYETLTQPVTCLRCDGPISDLSESLTHDHVSFPEAGSPAASTPAARTRPRLGARHDLGRTLLPPLRRAGQRPGTPCTSATSRAAPAPAGTSTHTASMPISSARTRTRTRSASWPASCSRGPHGPTGRPSRWRTGNLRRGGSRARP
ncbi:DUF6415 family natural product biosynthesis protein [Streptomyces sp. NPDC002845]